MKSKNGGPRLTVMLALLAISLLPGIAQAQNAPAPGGAKTYHMWLITPKDPNFDSTLAIEFPGLTEVNYFQNVKPLLAILHNDSGRSIQAYVVRWTITNADGSTSVADLPVVEEPVAQWMLTGQREVMRPRQRELVSPFFHWSLPHNSAMLRSNAAAIMFQAANTKPLVSSLSSPTAVQSTLDGVIFSDGAFSGPDTSLLYERFGSAQQAQVDEGGWLLDALNSGVTDQQLRDSLSQQIYQGRNSSGIDSGNLYAAARGEEASTLLSLLDGSDQTTARSLAARLAAGHPIPLHRVIGN